MSLGTTIILLSTDEGHHLRRSLPMAMAQEGAEVIVFDNASNDDTGVLAREHGAELRRFEERLPYTRAMNRALAECSGSAVLLLNPDCFLDAGFLAAARPRLEEPRVGSVAPKLIRTEGPEPAQRLDALDAAGMTIDRNRKNSLVGHGTPALGHDRPGEVFGVDGAAALYRRETIEQCMVEGQVMDTDFGRWTCDVDLAWRARLLGWRCVYEPAAIAHHIRYFSPSSRADMPAADLREQFRNRYLMMLKNDSSEALRRDLPRLLAYELLALGYVLLRERRLLGGYASAARLTRRALRKRRAVQERRMVAEAPLRAGEDRSGWPAALSRRYVKLCDRRDFEDPEVLAAIQKILPERDPARHIERKAWEFAMLALALRDLGRLHEHTRVLAIGAGDERMAFWLANRVGRVVAIDVYGEGDFGHEEARPAMLEDPASLAPFPYREDHLQVRWMDARRLDLPDESFDVAYSLSSIEHFGSSADIARSAREMGRVLRPGGHAIVVTDCFVRRSPLNSPLLGFLVHAATAGRKLHGATPRTRASDSVFTPRELQTRIVGPSGLRLLQPLDLRLSSATWHNVTRIDRGGLVDPGAPDYWPHILLQINRYSRPWVGRKASTFTSVCLVMEKPGA